MFPCLCGIAFCIPVAVFEFEYFASDHRVAANWMAKAYVALCINAFNSHCFQQSMLANSPVKFCAKPLKKRQEHVFSQFSGVIARAISNRRNGNAMAVKFRPTRPLVATIFPGTR